MAAAPHGSDSQPGQVTRIARRRALAGHEAQYEALVRAMFGVMREHHGFLGADLIPPEHPGEDHQVVVKFTDEDSLAAWDASDDRAAVHQRMRAHAVGEPEHRRLSGLEAWFAPAVVPASMNPPRLRMAFVTWLGIWPTASLALWLVAPLLVRLHLPFLLVTLVNTALITVVMTYLVMPRLARVMRPFLAGRQRRA
jgi:antibiotic biosynthesis monooxygenase (ABM) superfamily enzyme